MKHDGFFLRKAALATALAVSFAGCSEMMSTSSTFEDAQSAFEQGQYRVANAHLADLLAKGQTGEDVRKLQLELMLTMGDGNRALAALNELPESALDPDDRRIALAHAYVLQGAPEKAAQLYQALLQEEYTEQDFRMLLWALRDMDETEDFASGMDFALESFPDSPYLNALAADQLYDFGLPEEAAPFADNALENGSEVFEAHLVAGRKAISDEDLEQAIVHYRKAHELNPTNALPLSNVAGLYLDLERVEEAGEVIKLAVENYGDFPFLQWQVARYKLETGDLQGAREAKDKVERVYSDNPEFMLVAADIEAEFGNTGLALDNYRRFVREVGEVPEVMQKIAELEG
ncbi:MAG: tetratricopeptide repeat protein [Pseudomonadota bacterium]